MPFGRGPFKTAIFGSSSCVLVADSDFSSSIGLGCSIGFDASAGLEVSLGFPDTLELSVCSGS